MKKQVLVMAGILASAGLALAAAPQGRAGRGMGRGIGPGRGMGPDPIRCRQELNLTDAQVDQLRQLRLEQRRAEIRRRADIELMRLDLHSLLAGAKIDEKAVSAKAKELSDLEAASHKARIDGFLAMRRVLTPEQIEKLKDLRPLHGARPDAQRPHRRGLDRGLGPSGEGLSRDEVALTADENE